MDIQQILLSTKQTVILCKSSEYYTLKKELEAYFEAKTISRFYTQAKAFGENGHISTELDEHLKSGVKYEIALPKINNYANTGFIIRQMCKFSPKVIAILPDCPNYAALFFNVITYNA